ncbi:hypothetical protein V7S43_017152 [Phytophthora oleae]|uniref:Uncharacterized protein n=1 Tax=Phytophthora oleae TaxID=2107226 RepID=A0ABD3ETZ2_9STRA
MAYRPRDYRDTAWFKTSEGDLVFCQWLLDRCCSLSDPITLLSLEACSTLYSWLTVRQRLRHELGLNSSEESGRSTLCWKLEKKAREAIPSEKLVVAEVIESAAELLISRATEADWEALVTWSNLFVNEGSAPWLGEGEARAAGDQANDRIDSFLELILELVLTTEEQQEVEIPTVSEDAQDLWTSEIYEIEKLDVEEEERRR